MTLNEKALVKLMKAAYKGGGVKVYRTERDVLCLCGPTWACAMLWKYVPGPVLGLIAGWCHGLPEKGQGWWCMDAYGEQPEPVPDMPELLAALQRHHAQMESGLFTLDFVCMGYRAVQCQSMRIMWFEADGITMLGRLASFGGDIACGPDAEPWGRWYDPETGTVIFLAEVDRVRPDLTDKLSEIDYRKQYRGDNNVEA